MSDPQDPFKPLPAVQPPQAYGQAPYAPPPPQAPYGQPPYGQPPLPPDGQQPPPHAYGAPNPYGQQPPPPYGQPSGAPNPYAPPFMPGMMMPIDGSAQRAQGGKMMLIGGLLFVVGLVITVGTLSAASSGSGGGTYFVAYGPMIFGVIRFFQGVAKYASAPK